MSLTSLSQTHLCHWLHWVRLICVIDIEESGLVVKLKQWSQNQQFKVLKTPQSKKNILPIFKGFFLQLKKMQFQTVVSPVFLFLVQTHLDPKNYWQNSFEDVYLWDRWVTLHGVIDFAESDSSVTLIPQSCIMYICDTKEASSFFSCRLNVFLRMVSQ